MAATLDRFKQAQDDPHAGFSAALRELRAGRKRGHWIWYVFPQLAGLGMSAMSQRFAIADLDEAIAYLNDPLLGGRLAEATEAVAEQLGGDRGTQLAVLMGSELDARKLVSSLTLFREAARRSGSERQGSVARLAAAADHVLAAARTEGYEPCAFTLRAVDPHRTSS